MKTILLRLEGPLQSWATQSRLGVRDTDPEPSKSGVLGLVGAAIGMERDDSETLARLVTLRMAVRVDRAGLLLRDYHTAGGAQFRGAEYFVFDTKNTITSDRYYLQDASFLVGLSGDDDLIDKTAAALQAPKWPLFLGRRACPPSAQVFVAVVDQELVEAVRRAALSRSESVRQRGRGVTERLRLIVERTPEQGGEPRIDVPMSFVEGERTYAVRYVSNEWCDAPPQGDIAAPLALGAGGLS
jgi:CRISPR system Cascade subunit CasD